MGYNFKEIIVYKALVITTVSGEEIWISGIQLQQLYGDARLLVPSHGISPIGIEFQSHIARNGIAVNEVATKGIGMSTFIPPYQIKKVNFIVTENEPLIHNLNDLLIREE